MPLTECSIQEVAIVMYNSAECFFHFFLQSYSCHVIGGHEALLTSAPESVQRVSLSSVQDQSQSLADVLSKMTSKKVKQLIMIQTSKQFLSRLVRHLEQKAGQHDKFLR